MLAVIVSVPARSHTIENWHQCCTRTLEHCADARPPEFTPECRAGHRELDNSCDFFCCVLHIFDDPCPGIVEPLPEPPCEPDIETWSVPEIPANGLDDDCDGFVDAVLGVTEYPMRHFSPGVGARGGMTVALEISPTDPTFALAASELGGLFETRDNGSSWRHVDTLPARTTREVKFLPADARVVLVTSGKDGAVDPSVNTGGIWRSVDEGATWSHALLPCAGAQSAHAIAFAPNGDVYVGTDCGLVVSHDRGATWPELEYSSAVLSVVADSRSIVIFDPGRGAYRTDMSRDGAGRLVWSPLANGPNCNSARCLALSPFDDQVIFATNSQNSILESDDGGRTWVDLQAAPYNERPIWVETRQIGADSFHLHGPGLRQTCSRAPGPSGLRCTPPPAPPASAWSRVPDSGLNHDVNDIAFSAIGNCPQLQAQDYGIVRADPIGATVCSNGAGWLITGTSATGIPLQLYDVTGQVNRGDAAASPHTDLFVGTQDNMIWNAYDAARPVWDELAGAEGLHIQTVYDGTGLSGTQQRVTMWQCAGCSAVSVVRQPDGTFGPKPVDRNRNAWTQSDPPGNGDPPFIVGPDTYVQTMGDNLYLTTDAGASWTNVARVLRRLGPPVVAGPPSDPTIYIGTRTTPEGPAGITRISGIRGPDGSPTPGVVQCIGNGCGYGESLGNLLTFSLGFESFAVFGVDPSAPNHLIAADAGSAVMKVSRDGGATWTADDELTRWVTTGGFYSFDSQPMTIQFDPEDGQRIAVGTATAGIAFSKDGGSSWALARGSRVPGFITRFFFDALSRNSQHSGVAYVSSYARGLWRMNFDTIALSSSTFPLIYVGNTEGHVGVPLTVAAVLTDPSTSPAMAIDGVRLHFSLGAVGCDAWTNAAGRAECTIVPSGSGGQAVFTAFDGNAQYGPVSIWTPVSLFGGVEPCDGLDNNGNGNVDEGCDRVCDAPQEFASDVKETIASGDSIYPVAAWTGSGYGVAWHDNRDGNWEIYFKRITASGAGGSSDMRVTSTSGDSVYPSVSWNGNGFGVAWVDSRNGLPEVYFAQLDPSGNKLGSDVRVTPGSVLAASPTLAWNGYGYGLAWAKDGPNESWEVYFCLLNPTGERVSADILVTQNRGLGEPGEDAPSLAWLGAGNGYAIAYHRSSSSSIDLARLDSNGTRLWDRAITPASTGSDPAVVHSVGGFGIAWHDTRHGLSEIYFANTDDNGVVVGSERRITNASGASESPSLVWTGGEYALAWHDWRTGNAEIYFTRVTSSGVKEGNDLQLTGASLESGNPSMAWTGTEFGMVWNDRRDGNYELYFTRVGCCDDADADGWSECGGDTNDQDTATHPGARELCNGHDDDADGLTDETCDTHCDAPRKAATENELTAYLSEVPALAWNGAGYGVAWHDWRHGSAEIYFARLNTWGSKIGPETRVTNDLYQSGNPSIAWTGRHYGVAWNDSRNGNYEIYFTRLNELGKKVGADVRVTDAPGDSTYPSLVWNGTEFGVTWTDLRDGNEEIYFARIDALGNKVGGDRRITQSIAPSISSSLAWTGTSYGIVWSNAMPLPTTAAELFYTLVDPFGDKLISETRLTYAAQASESPFILWNGSEFGIAWHDWRDGNAEIYFARLSGSGSRIGTDVRVTTNSLESGNPVLAWTGTEYGLAWNDRKDGNYEIYFLLLPTGGAPHDVTRVTAFTGDSIYPSLVWTGEDFGAAWEDLREGNGKVYFARIGCCDDADQDGFNECVDDCDDSNPTYHPETNDGVDNTCPGLPGYGLVDEIAPTAGFLTLGDKSTYSWDAQPGATSYTVARAQDARLATGCTSIPSIQPWINDTALPPSGSVFFYLVRASDPHVGSWGTDSAGVERSPACN